MRPCVNCGKPTENAKFCSRSCAATHNNKTSPKRRLQGECKLCKNPIPSGYTYCKKCFAENRYAIISKGKSNRPKSESKNKRRIRPPCNQIVCIQCLKTFLSHKTKTKYCSPKCQSEYQFNKRIEKAEKIGCFYNSKKFNTSAEPVKKYLRNKFGDQCSICGQPPIWQDKPLTLILDHIDGKPNNWAIENLRLVCRHCDSQLPTFGSKNTGNGGRPNRHKQKLE